MANSSSQQPTIYLIGSFLLMMMTIISFINGFETDAYRLIQYDKGTQQYGSRLTGVNSPISLLANSSSSTTSTSLLSARNIIILNIEQLTKSASSSKNSKLQLSLLINREDVSGLLIILPNTEKNLSLEVIEQFKSIEKQFLVSKFEKPIYFIYESDKTNEMIKDIQNSNRDAASDSILNESYQAIISEQEAKSIDQIQVVNLHSVLNPQKQQQQQNTPQTTSTIGIVAHYDSISSIPGLSNSGSFGDGTGVIGLLEIARLFQKINQQQKGLLTTSNSNLLFILTGASRLGFSGTKHWLKSVDQRLVNQLDFVLCLDSLVSYSSSASSNNKLFIHISEKTTDRNVVNLFKQFVKTAKQMQIDLQFVEKKVSDSNTSGGGGNSREIMWEHEIFSKKGISAATISSQSSQHSSSLLMRTNSLDQLPLDVEQLKRSVRLVIESIVNHLAASASGDSSNNNNNNNNGGGSNNVQSLLDQHGSDEKFIRSFLKMMTKSSRFTPTLNKDNELVKNLKVTLQQYTGQTAHLQDFIIGNSPYKFFTNTIVKLSIQKVSPLSLDLILVSCVLLYLLALHVYLVGVKSFSANFTSLFEKQERNTNRASSSSGSK